MPWYLAAVLPLALSTGHKLGLGLSVAAFAGFSLVVSMLVPRWRPQFPGRGLGVFLVVISLMFLGMLAAVEIFGKESEEAHAESPAATETTTSTTTRKTAAPTTVDVKETEFKIELGKGSLPAGSYVFDVHNEGQAPHDLVIEGEDVDAATPTIEGGESKTLKVELQPGSYEVYCSIPGHKEAGMELKLTVS